MNIQKLSIILFFFFSLISCKETKSTLPNIIIIYADDMGYGDLNCQNPNSKIPTPNLDQLASEGMRFTDAHSSSGICSPSRYALLTGSYHWRRQHGIVGAFGKPFFNDDDITLPQILKSKNYATACIGKWHLGWNWEFYNEPSTDVKQWGRNVKAYGPEDVDWTKPVGGGPLARGFDYYYGDGTINFPPYAWMENDSFLEAPTDFMDIHQMPSEPKEGAWEFRPGPKVKGWDPYKVLPSLTQRTLNYIEEQDPNNPFFLYFALPAPHAPIIPNDEFDGKSEAGAYGDFIFQTDWIVGEVLKKLKKQGLEENTIIIFSADNGTEHYAWQRAINFEHYSMGDFRGLKRDVWEGGHRVPFIIKWPGKIRPGSTSDQLVSQMDIMSTLAEITEAAVPEKAAPDSYSLLPILFESTPDASARRTLIHNTNAKIWGIRHGEYLYINGPTGGLRPLPENFKDITGYQDFTTDGILFNMTSDPQQKNNLIEINPEKASELAEVLELYRDSKNSKDVEIAK